MSSSEQIRESIEARLGELQTEITSLEAARAALQTNGRSRARSRPAATGSAARKPKRRRSSVSASEATATTAQTDPAPAAPATSEPSAKPAVRSRKPRATAQSKPATRRKPAAVLVPDQLEAILSNTEDGLNAVAIAKQASARDTQVRELLRELEGAGRVRRTGAGWASRWRVITDEERIAERAAELAALSTTKS